MTLNVHSVSGRSEATTRPDQEGAAEQAATGSSAPSGKRARRPDRKGRFLVNWYAAALIVMALLLAAAGELWRWVLLIMTLD